MAFAARELLPDRRADLRAAMQAFTTARAGGAKGVQLDNFLLDTWRQPATEADEQDQAEMSRQMAKVAGMFEAAEAARKRQQELADKPRRESGTLDGK